MSTKEGTETSTDASAAELSNLKQQRTNMKRNINNLKIKIEREGAKADATILECQLQILESYFKQISHVQTQMEKYAAADNIRGDIEEIFIAAKSKIIYLLNKQRRSSIADQSLLSTTHVHSSHASRLPKLKLPKFNGDYMEYSRFMHAFEALVDSDSTLSTIDKFNYLLDCLTGPALAVIEPFQVEEINYRKALDRLKQRFDNKSLIFIENIKTLFALANVDKHNPATLRSLIDRVASIKGSLLSLGSETDVMNALFIHIILSKLDASSKEAYEEKQDFKELPSFDACYDILSRRCQFLESRLKKPESTESSSSTKQKPPKALKTFLTSKSSCSYCKSAEHTITHCNSFLAAPVTQRFDFVKKNSLCVNCLGKGHTVSKCVSQSRCRVCHGQHHTQLHRFSVSPTEPAASTAFSFQNPDLTLQPTSSSELPQSILKTSTALLARTMHRAIIPTAVIYVKDNCNVFQPVRALLDSCSELNFMTEETAKMLRLKFHRTQQQIAGIADTRTSIKFEVEATVKSRCSSFEWTSQFAVTKSISANQPGEIIRTSEWNLPENIVFADPAFWKPHKIDVLIGTEVFFDLLVKGKISLGENQPNLINTVFGWVVSGKTNLDKTPRALTCHMTTQVSEINIENTLKRFWEIEDYFSPAPQHSEEEKLCEQHFRDHTNFASDGRVQVRLPFRYSEQLLGDSFQIARRRFLSLERRLERDPQLKKMYADFMDEYTKLGHMSPISYLHGHNYVIPHHSVLRLQSSSTKLRVVFDASAKTPSNYSLNDLLMVGPTIQQELITTLLSFRLNKFAITADICKMYRQFWVHEQDRRFQYILWRKNSTDDLQLYKLNTITYGTSAAPFLAVRSLYFIAEKYEDLYPIGAEVLKTDLYVDDVLTGADTIKELQQKRFELTKILSLAKLNLAKWNSNCNQLLDSSNNEVFLESPDDVAKALGMAWKPRQDVFCFQVQAIPTESPTKRIILSFTAKIFDLLGLVCPIVIRFKILIQEIWIQKLDWDQPLPSDLQKCWTKMRDDMLNIHLIKISRYVLTSLKYKSEIHGFADASERAYACCIYVRTRINDSYETSLLIAKSKVAPVKAQSLPRLELCATLLLIRTWNKFKGKLSSYIEKVTFWTDSKIVLLWIKTHASTLASFVANRVTEIQEHSSDIIWRHVPSKENPADIASRGCSAVELQKTIWFTGPEYLKKEENEWPATNGDVPLIEKKRPKWTSFKCSHTTSDTDLIEQIIERHSSYIRILRIVAYIHRVFNKILSNKKLKSSEVTPLSPEEIEAAFHFIASKLQESQFSLEISNIRQNKILSASFQRLSPFLCDATIFNKQMQLLRVGGRLSQAPIPVEAKFPLLLPKNHRFTKLYVQHLHRFHLHAGPKVLLGLLRQRVWIINARNVVRRVVRHCVHCFKYKPILAQQIMADLPADRLKAQRPFLICGVDFCGPFKTSYRIRSKVPYKTYVAIFVCFVSKAVHMELVSDLSADSFIGCLKRFVGRRGIPKRIYCDNATNFIGARNQLKEFYDHFLTDSKAKNVQDFCHNIGFTFCFIPPRSPHFGGLWEAAVKAAKHLMIKNMSESNLTYEELTTIIIEVESILNSRPLSPRSDDPNDGEALTPSHLLTGDHLLSIPQPELQVENLSYLKRWQRITFLKQQFWRQWLSDYVLELRTRSKWTSESPNIQLGQLVLIHEDNLPPQQWLLARIIRTIPGSDGKVRVVELKTKGGILRRSVHKLAPLPLSS